MITKAEYAEWIGHDNTDISDAEFKRILAKGVARLEQALGYQLCPLEGLGIKFCPLVDTPTPTPEELAKLPVVKIPYRGFWQRFIELPPFLKVYSVKFTDCDGDVQVLEDCDYVATRPGGHMFINSPFYNSIEMCRPLLCGLPARGLMCPGNCITLEIQAYWGLCCGPLSDGADERECCIPDDLKVVLLDMMAEADPCDKSNIKSESMLSHSYTKFEKQDLTSSYSGILSKYGSGKLEDYPI